MDVFELRGIDAPLIRGDLQPIKNGRQGVSDVVALVVAADAAGPVDKLQVRFQAEINFEEAGMFS
jgi:hypothetical protein